ncbi:ATP-binding protein [Pseudanabaena sp. 'Roaring Creek']|uniref:ATP-binding protein n=1 Tax=Pseudanabaena sp. 'Roaring Creek' TaxID=1681830 RepID=UPI0018D05494|nr:ATP-binding protein [Pseudanabaena sp. 'Roaring Creek']
MPQPPQLVTKQLYALEILSSLSYRTGELQGYLQLVAKNVSELIGIDWSVVTFCREGLETVLASSIDIGDFSDRQVSLHGTLTEAVINSGSCMYVENTSIDQYYRGVPEGYHAYLGAPLRLPTGEIIGTICSFHRQPRKFSRKDIRLVEIFAERAATAIDNFNLYQQQQETNQKLQGEIKQRQEIEQALRKSEELLRQIAENLEPLVWMYSRDGEPIYMSPMFEKVWGIPLEQWYLDGTVCLNLVHPEDRQNVSIAFKSMFTGECNYNLEYRIIRPDNSIRTIRDRAFPIIDETGKVFRIAGLADDITERQREQKQTLEAKERLSEIGELATSIVHEVRNPLTTVLMGLNFFQRTELSESAQKRLTLALEEGERLKRLLNEILLYSKHEMIQKTPVDINELIRDVVENISTSQLAISKQIHFEPLPETKILYVDRDKLKQVSINLLQNACEAVTEDGEISVFLSSLTNSNQVCIKVHNGGAFISPEMLSKITKPFFTTKSSGNGLGLSIVKKIVDAHGGKLEIESSAIAGTTVSIFLPMNGDL